MLIENNHIYHIYNQGNNRQKIFFRRENYLFFLRKMKEHISPFGDIMAWCLMPNHFHWMVYVRESIIVSENYKPDSRVISNNNSPGQLNSRGATTSRTPTSTPTSTPTQSSKNSFNKSIGVLLASYTRAINKQENTTGSLFRDKTKAECLTKFNGITPSFFNAGYGTIINIPNPEKEYPQVCFNYIHENPVKAGLVKNAEDWEFSSYQDICGMRNGKLIDRNRIDEFGLIIQ